VEYGPTGIKGEGSPRFGVLDVRTDDTLRRLESRSCKTAAGRQAVSKNKGNFWGLEDGFDMLIYRTLTGHHLP